MARCLLDTPLELVIGLAKRRDPAAGCDSRCPACFPALLAPNRDREIGGGRATRQPGQVRKEAALTRSGSGRSSVSYLFFERIAQKAAGFALRARAVGVVFAKTGTGFATRMRFKLAIETGRKTLNCGSIDDRRWRPSCRARER